MAEEKLSNLALSSIEDKVRENLDCKKIISDLLKWRQEKKLCGKYIIIHRLYIF